MATGSDTTSESRYDELLLRRFLAARAKGDEPGARLAWEELVCLNMDRVEGMVRAESHQRLSREEQEEAVQNAAIKVLNNMFITFNGTSMGQWVNAVRTLVKGVCIDVQRRAERHSKHRAPLHGEDDTQDGFTAAVKRRLPDSTSPPVSGARART